MDDQLTAVFVVVIVVFAAIIIIIICQIMRFSFGLENIVPIIITNFLNDLK